MYIIMLGGPGTGKGTVGGKIAKDFNLAHIATGDMFREEIKNQTEFGKRIESYISKGLLVPDELVIETVENRLMKNDAENGVVLDGFPRTVNQAKALAQFLKDNGKKITMAVELNISDENIIKRIVNRVMCSNKECGAIYNTEFKPPKVENICDICGGALIKRKDDNEETVKQRLKVYHETSKDLLKYYQENGLLYTVYPDIYSETVLEDSVSSVETYLKKEKEVF